MNISEASKGWGITAKAIRYYESINLIATACRHVGGYRAFDSEDVHTLRFIARPRGLGFSVSEVASLLALYKDKSRTRAQVYKIADNAITRIDDKISELETIFKILSTLVARCHGYNRPECRLYRIYQVSSDKRKPYFQSLLFFLKLN